MTTARHMDPVEDAGRHYDAQDAHSARLNSAADAMGDHMVNQIRHGVDERMPSTIGHRTVPGHLITEHLGDCSGEAAKKLFAACTAALNGDRADVVADLLVEFVSQVADDYAEAYAESLS